MSSLYAVDNVTYGTFRDNYGIERTGFTIELYNTTTGERINDLQSFSQQLPQISNIFTYEPTTSLINITTTDTYFTNGPSFNVTVGFTQYLTNSTSTVLFVKHLTSSNASFDTPSKIANAITNSETRYELLYDGGFSALNSIGNGYEPAYREEFIEGPTTKQGFTFNESNVVVYPNTTVTLPYAGNVVSRLITTETNSLRPIPYNPDATHNPLQNPYDQQYYSEFGPFYNPNRSVDMYNDPNGRAYTDNTYEFYTTFSYNPYQDPASELFDHEYHDPNYPAYIPDDQITYNPYQDPDSDVYDGMNLDYFFPEGQVYQPFHPDYDPDITFNPFQLTYPLFEESAYYDTRYNDPESVVYDEPIPTVTLSDYAVTDVLSSAFTSFYITTNASSPFNYTIVLTPYTSIEETLVIDVSNTTSFDSLMYTGTLLSNTPITVPIRNSANTTTDSFYVRVNATASNFANDTIVQMNYGIFIRVEDNVSLDSFPPHIAAPNQQLSLAFLSDVPKEPVNTAALPNTFQSQNTVFNKTNLVVTSASFGSAEDIAGITRSGFILQLSNTNTNATVTDVSEFVDEGISIRSDITNSTVFERLTRIGFQNDSDTLGFPLTEAQIITNSTGLYLFSIGNTSIQHDSLFPYPPNLISEFLRDDFYTLYVDTNTTNVLPYSSLLSQTNLTVDVSSVTVNTTVRTSTEIPVYGRIVVYNSHDTRYELANVTDTTFKTQFLSATPNLYDVVLTFTPESTPNAPFKLQISNSSSFPVSQTFTIDINTTTTSTVFVQKYNDIMDISSDVIHIRTTTFLTENVSVNVTSIMYEQIMDDPESYPISKSFSSSLLLQEGVLLLPEFIAQTYRLTNISVFNAAYREIQDIYGVPKTGYVLTCLDTRTNTTVNSISEFNSEGIYAKSDLFNVEEKYNTFYLFDGITQAGKLSERGQILQSNGSYVLFIEGQDGLNDNATIPNISVNDINDSQFFFYTDTVDESMLPTLQPPPLLTSIRDDATIRIQNVTIDSFQSFFANTLITGNLTNLADPFYNVTSFSDLIDTVNARIVEVAERIEELGPLITAKYGERNSIIWEIFDINIGYNLNRIQIIGMFMWKEAYDYVIESILTTEELETVQTIFANEGFTELLSEEYQQQSGAYGIILTTMYLIQYKYYKQPFVQFIQEKITVDNLLTAIDNLPVSIDPYNAPQFQGFGLSLGGRIRMELQFMGTFEQMFPFVPDLQNQLQAANATIDSYTAEQAQLQLFDYTDSLFDYFIQVRVEDADLDTNITLDISNVQTFNTVFTSVELDTVNPSNTLYAPLQDIYSITEKKIFTQINQYLNNQNEVNLIITSVPIQKVQYSNGTTPLIPLYLGPASETRVTIQGTIPVQYEFDPFINALNVQPPIRNQSLSYVDSIGTLNELETGLLSSYRIWQGDLPDLPSLNISHTSSALRMKVTNNSTIQSL